MRPSLAAILILSAAPALVQAEGRHDTLMTCEFAGESVSVIESGGMLTLKVGETSVPADLRQPNDVGRIGVIFAMLESGPMMIAVEVAGESGPHTAAVTSAARTRDGLATRTVEGTCVEGAK